MKNQLILTAASVGALSGCTQQENRPKDLNVIYILADDLGYGDLGCYGQTKIHTPNIDRLAAEGMLFTQHYAGCTVSAPSRSALMTGQHTGHTPIRGNKGGTGDDGVEGQHPIPADTYTLGKMFRQAGYVTGTFGKWGLGSPGSEGDPTYQGFDEFFGYNCQALAHKYYPTHLWHNREKILLDGNDLAHTAQYSHDIIQERTLDFIRRNKERKFFAFLAYTLPHAELLVPEDEIIEAYRGRFEEKPYAAKSGDYSPEGKHPIHYCSQPEPRTSFAAMVTRLDRYVGEETELIDSLGLRKRTIIIFTSDNGPHREGGADPDFFGSYGPLRGIKRDMYEGGIRVPMIARCPGLIAEGTRTDFVSAFWDVLPTFADMAGAEVPANVDGISMLPTLFGEKGQQEHEYLYWEFHENGGKTAVRTGNWKGIRLNVGKDPEGPIELYDLSTDIHEDRNVADEHPEIVREIAEIMRTARIPSPLFNFGQANGAM